MRSTVAEVVGEGKGKFRAVLDSENCDLGSLICWERKNERTDIKIGHTAIERWEGRIVGKMILLFDGKGTLPYRT